MEKSIPYSVLDQSAMFFFNLSLVLCYTCRHCTRSITSLGRHRTEIVFLQRLNQLQKTLQQNKQYVVTGTGLINVFHSVVTIQIKHIIASVQTIDFC